jgi:hypothetical protein
MKYIDEEDKEKLHELGAKILQAKKLRQEITEFFVENSKNIELSEENYYGSDQLLSIVYLYIEGESLDYIGEQIFQSDGDPIREMLQSMNINEKEGLQNDRNE